MSHASQVANLSSQNFETKSRHEPSNLPTFGPSDRSFLCHNDANFRRACRVSDREVVMAKKTARSKKKAGRAKGKSAKRATKRKAAPKKKAAAKKKAAPKKVAKKAAPVKKMAPMKKAAPVKKVAPKKPAPQPVTPAPAAEPMLPLLPEGGSTPVM
jgi:hypothetical protein